MKKYTFTTLILFLLMTGFSLSAQDYTYERGFYWNSPRLLAQGNSGTANAAGFEALTTNPAGLSSPLEDDLTILSLSANAIANPYSLISDFQNDPSDFIAPLLDQLINNGLGASAQVGSGILVNGLGVGLFYSGHADAPRPKTILGVSASAYTELAVVVGYAGDIPVGIFDISLGADVRPTWRTRVPDISLVGLLMDSSSLDLMSMLQNDLYTGFALAFDAGAKIKWNWVTFGLSFRDIGGTHYNYRYTDLENGIFFNSTGSTVDEDYTTPAVLRTGLDFTPAIPGLKAFFLPSLHCEYEIPLLDEENYENYTYPSFFNSLNIGAEISLVSMLRFRGGFQSGYGTAGFGLDLPFAEINFAIYGQETGKHAGQKSQVGTNLEMALRL